MTEEALDQLAAGGRRLESSGYGTVRVAVEGITALNAPRLQPGAQAVYVLGFVRDQAFGRGHRLKKRPRYRDVGYVARRQRERNRSAARIGQAMDLASSLSLPERRSAAWG